MRRSFYNIKYYRPNGETYRIARAPISGIWHVDGTLGDFYATCQDMVSGVIGFPAKTLNEVSARLKSL